MGQAYRIAIPGALYESLTERGAFTGPDPLDVSALRAMECAARRPHGRGFRYEIVGGEKALRHILGYIGDMAWVLDNTSLTGSEYNSRRSIMARVARQNLRPALVQSTSVKGAEWMPVRHSVTGEIVGYHRPGEFWDLDKRGNLPASHRIKEG